LTQLQDILEDFGRSQADVVAAELQEASRISEADLEGQKLEAFEKGYRAGWDDAVAAQTDDKARISSALGQHLQDLSFTYHEAYGQVMNAVTPLLGELVETVLPQIARATIGLHIAEHLEKLSHEIGTCDVEIAVAPDKIEAVAPLLDGSFGFPVKLVPDDTLAEEQADIRFGTQERQIDLSDLVTSVTEAVQGFAHDNQRKISNG